MRIGGPKELVDAVKAAGRQPGPMSVWVTGGAHKWGTGNIDAHYAACKAAGVDPLILFWYWGDDISTPAINNGVIDQYQKMADGSPIKKTKDGGYGFAKAIGQKAKAAGVSPIVAIEHEFAQSGLETDRSAFAPYWLECARIIKAECPTARIVFTVPIWEDELAIARVYGDLIAKADMVGSQTLLFAPRHGSKEFVNAGANLLAAFKALRGLASGKPSCIVDLGFSSYGGAYSPTPPFLGGTGNGNDALQAQALKSIADLAPQMNLEFIMYRALKDAPNFDVKNYGGHAERHVGLVRSDGSRKPAYDVLMAMALPPPPPPPPPDPLQEALDALKAVRASLAASQAHAKALEAQVLDLSAQLAARQRTIDAVRQAVGP